MTRVTDEMVERACVAGDFADRVGIRRALEAVEAELCAQEPGPFVLTRDEQVSFDRAGSGGSREYGPLLSRAEAFDLHEALDRAVRTLGPQPTQDTSDQNGAEWDDGDSWHDRNAQGGAFEEWTLADAQAMSAAVNDIADTNRESSRTRPRVMESALKRCFPRGKPVASGISEEELHTMACGDLSADQQIDIAAHCSGSARPVAQELTKEERETVETARQSRPREGTLAWFLLAVIDEHFPKPALSEPADPVRAVLEEIREGYADDSAAEKCRAQHWASKLEAALAARDAQKAGK